MLTERHKGITDKIWEIANRLRGPYRPPQYRLVMLPMVVLRRLDCVLEPTKDAQEHLAQDVFARIHRGASGEALDGKV